MPVHFTIIEKDNYYRSEFIGAVEDHEMVAAYREFLQGDQWRSCYNALVDLSKFDGSKVTKDGMERLQRVIAEEFAKHDVHPKVAVFAPADLQFGLTRMYSVGAQKFEKHEVFRSIGEAREWLLAE